MSVRRIKKKLKGDPLADLLAGVDGRIVAAHRAGDDEVSALLVRARALVERLKDAEGVMVTPSERGVLVSCERKGKLRDVVREGRESTIEFGGFYWEVDFWWNGRVGISIDWDGTGDTRARKVLKAIGQLK